MLAASVFMHEAQSSVHDFLLVFAYGVWSSVLHYVLSGDQNSLPATAEKTYFFPYT